MNEQVIRQKSLRKFDKDAYLYEQTSDGKFCSRAYPAILQKIHEMPFATLLDVGCGTGAILSRISADARRCGLDLSPQMIERAKECVQENAELLVGDAEALPWANETFDTVCCTFSFHHYPSPEKVLAEMHRVMKPGGRLIIADPWMPVLMRQICNAAIPYSDGGDYHCYSKREMNQMLLKIGLVLRSFEHPTHDSFLMVAQKEAAGGGAQNG